MFVKVTELITVNTDHVVAIEHEGNQATVYLTRALTLSANVVISLDAASFLMELLEVSQALDFSPEAKDYEQTLTSRLAQTLRDSLPYGATVAQLSALLDKSEDETLSALLVLKVENVVKLDESGDVHLWFHASHAPKPFRVR